jgi:hypothetical protein
LEVRIVKELRTSFAEVRIPKGLAVSGRIEGKDEGAAGEAVFERNMEYGSISVPEGKVNYMEWSNSGVERSF